MPTIITHTVIPGGAGDYSTLQAWETAQQRDLVAVDEVARALCTNVSATADTTVATVAGWTLDATRKILIEAGTAHGGVFNTGAYYLSHTTAGAGLTFNDPSMFADVTGIQVTTSNANGDGFQQINSSGTGTVLFDKCIVRNTNATPAAGSIGFFLRFSMRVNLRNCLIYDMGEGVWWFEAAGVGNAHNCTVYNCDTSGFHAAGTAPVLKNCATMACTDGFVGTWGGASTNNASDVASDAPGSNPQTGSISFVDAAGKDFHLASGDTVAKNNGATLTGDATLPVTEDVDGTARPQGAAFDIGFDELIEAAIKTGRLSAIEALLTYTEKRSRLSAVETLATYTEKRSRLSAAEVLVTFAEKRARLTAVESLLTYSEKRALLSAVEALATYSEKHARLSALEALLTYSEKHARVTALETLATYTEKRAQLSAIETLTTYSLKRARLSAAETLVTYSEKRALLSAIEVLVDYLATGGAPGGETARLTAIEVLITFTARQLAQQYPMDATIRTRVGHLLRPQVFVHPTRRKPT